MFTIRFWRKWVLKRRKRPVGFCIAYFGWFVLRFETIRLQVPKVSGFGLTLQVNIAVTRIPNGSYIPVQTVCMQNRHITLSICAAKSFEPN